MFCESSSKLLERKLTDIENTIESIEKILEDTEGKELFVVSKKDCTQIVYLEKGNLNNYKSKLEVEPLSKEDANSLLESINDKNYEIISYQEALEKEVSSQSSIRANLLKTYC